MKAQKKASVPSSTARLREIKNKALEFFSDKPGCIGGAITLHFFEDCVLCYYRKGNREPLPRLAAFSKDRGKTWADYHDQFEPAEGFHHAVEYDPFDKPFPTKEW